MGAALTVSCPGHPAGAAPRGGAGGTWRHGASQPRSRVGAPWWVIHPPPPWELALSGLWLQGGLCEHLHSHSREENVPPVNFIFPTPRQPELVTAKRPCCVSDTQTLLCERPAPSGPSPHSKLLGPLRK